MENKEIKKFPQDARYEISLILRDDNYDSLKKYIMKFIDQILLEFVIPNDVKDKIVLELISDVSIAADRFMLNGGDKKDYKFSTYYSWYIQERLKNILKLKDD